MKTYQRSIIFTKVPLTGYYRYKDIFQIFPANFPEMPDSSFKRDYPVILEYWFAEDEKITIESEFENLRELSELTAVTFTKRERILSLLTSFTNNRFFSYSDLDGFWGIPMLYDEITDEVSDEINSWSAKWCLKGYHYPGLPIHLKIEKFSTPLVQAVQKLPHIFFYTFQPSLDGNKEDIIVFPNTIDSMFDTYFSLKIETRTILDAAIGYNVAAIELSKSKRTLSLLASFTSMETMINLEYRNFEGEKCKSCGQLKYSVSKKFKDYLLKYIGDSPENKKKFNSYYSLRSKIVHTGIRLKSELLFSEFAKNDLDQEYITRIEILQIGKLAIANWLIKNKTEF